MTAEVRLQKLLADAGIASRRKCEDIIAAGRVQVDGKVVRQMGTKVDPARSRVTVDGRPVHLPKRVYFLVNKPKGYICTAVAQDDRPTIFSLFPGIQERLFTVGRLDEDSEGLIIVTNDGELANRVAHPRYGVPRTYRVEVGGRVSPEQIERLGEGVWISDGKVRASAVKTRYVSTQKTILEIVLREGRNREVRRMLAKIGLKVRRLKRIAIGPVTDKSLAAGQWRPLGRKEIAALLDASRPSSASRRKAGRRRS